MLSNREIIVPYVLPYFAYVGLAAVPVDVLSREINYGLRLAVVGLLLLWSRRWYMALTGPGSPWVSILWGVAFGLAGTALWILLLFPFVAAEAPHAWSGLAFFLRLAAATLLVPIFEELLMRGFVFRLALQWDQERRTGVLSPLQVALDERSLHDVRPGEWSWMAVIISTAAFAAGHGMAEWPAAVVYGLLMCGLWVIRRDLVSCIAAHATTNASLALYVLLTGSWQYW